MKRNTALTIAISTVGALAVTVPLIVSTAQAMPAPVGDTSQGTSTSLVSVALPATIAEPASLAMNQREPLGPVEQVLNSGGTVTAFVAADAHSWSGQVPTAAITGSPSKKAQKAVRKHNKYLPIVVAHSAAAKDMHGRMPSLYRGKYFYADQESFRMCVAQREGMFTYNVRGGGGGNYYGTYQFSSAFQHGIPYMMAKESRQTGDGLEKEMLALRHKPITQWNRYAQDRAFATVMNYNGKWSGKGHWAGGRWSC